MDCETLIVGSGFGGAVCACRLAEGNQRVVVLERGRRWSPEEYPRRVGDAWFYDPDEPERQNGWIDLRFFSDMVVAQGAGVGGGSLIYANVSVVPPPETFELGWPPEITYRELEPHFEEVGRMLGVQTLPDGQLTERFRLMREGAEALGYGDRFRKLPLAVSFDPDWSYDLPDPHDERHSKPFVNLHGVEQGTCVHLGYCDIGCPVKARNTLDLNYLAVAERRGAEIRPLHVVSHLAPEGSGYRVFFRRIAGGRLEPMASLSAERVILAAGSLGSTEILLRSRDEFRTLPKLSPFLGEGWSANGDFLTPAFYQQREIYPWKGPTITSAIDFLDGSVGDRRYFIEDGGFPDLAGDVLRRVRRGLGKRDIFARALRQVLRNAAPLSNVMPWFSQGVDAADGRLYLGRRWFAPWKRKVKLDWEVLKSRQLTERIIAMHKRLATATGGEPRVPPTWRLLLDLITPHPLGGCNMGVSPERGVVDHRGQVFGYPRLYVADGAVVPEALGLNPSRTIAALAERTAKLLEA
ncbi:MAG: GMC oxidoreductase [Thermoanaerobaculia bacterium]